MRHAHSLIGRLEDAWEPLLNHLVNVGARAAEYASVFGAEQIAGAAGLLHDIGKCSDAYQAYIRDAGSSPDHSTAGAIEAIRRFRSNPLEGMFARLIAFAIAGHHAGLADGTGPSAASLDSRLIKDVPAYLHWQEEATGLPGRLTITSPFKLGRSAGYSLAFLGRMLFSCLPCRL